MFTPISITAMFQSVGIPHGPSLPLIVLVAILILSLPAIFRPSGQAKDIATASYCYLAQMFGIIVMSGSALPALYAVFAEQPLAEVTYLGLLIGFAIGGFVFLYHDTKLLQLDAAARAIPGAIFFMTWKFVGLLTIVVTGLSFTLRLMLAAERTQDWWTLHLTVLLYGLVISWFTLQRQERPVRHHHAPVKRVLIAKRSGMRKN